MALDLEQKKYCLENLEVYVQQVVDVTQRVTKYELLTRIPADAGLPSIESFFGELTALESLDISINHIRTSKKIFDKTGLPCSINVDNLVLLDDQLKDRLSGACEAIDYPVILEFTELRPMPPSQDVNAFFYHLKRNNITIALDDFGTGFNGMSIFADYDFDIIKIDRTLINGLQTRPQKLFILKHMLDLMDAISKEHIVEGVETQAQFDTLRDVGFRNFQGYLFHHPSPLEEIL